MDTALTPPANWQDWIVVAGYLVFLLFIIWRVLVSSRS